VADRAEVRAAQEIPVRTHEKRKNQTGFTGLKTGLTGYLFYKILNPVNPEESC
jgi:hypothetical protein